MKAVHREQLAGLLGGTEPQSVIQKIKTSRRVSLVSDSGARNAIAKNILRVICSSTTLLWYPEVGVFPSSEMPSLFRRIRISEGLPASVYEYPGDYLQLEEFGDLDYGACCVAHALSSFWDLLIVDLSSYCMVFFSHDEFACASAEDVARQDRIYEFLKGFER